jgi:nucleoside-diphosphate-sugar epimerase
VTFRLQDDYREPSTIQTMTEPATILVTGATGKLGAAVCRSLLDRGHPIRATDLRYAKDFPVRVELGDLRDELFAHRVVEGCDTVVHLGNHPNAFVGLSPQKLLSENVTMNANVFHAALDHRVRSIVFASSVQVTIKRNWDAPEPSYVIPYLPLDGDLPATPGTNTYAQSKEFAERMLRLAVESHPDLSATAVRFPMIVNEWLARRLSGHLPAERVNFAECTAHLFLEDAADFCGALLAKRSAGYRQYFPAQTMELDGYPLADVLRDRYAGVPLKRPISAFSSLIDLSAIQRDLGWAPRERLKITVDR